MSDFYKIGYVGGASNQRVVDGKILSIDDPCLHDIRRYARSVVVVAKAGTLEDRLPMSLSSIAKIVGAYGPDLDDAIIPFLRQDDHLVGVRVPEVSVKRSARSSHFDVKQKELEAKGIHNYEFTYPYNGGSVTLVATENLVRQEFQRLQKIEPGKTNFQENDAAALGEFMFKNYCSHKETGKSALVFAANYARGYDKRTRWSHKPVNHFRKPHPW